MDVVGIDVSKADFHACLIQGSNRSKKSFPNAPVGYRQMQTWLKNRGCRELHACMEATGAYWEGLAKALHDAGMMVSVVNPSQTAFFARSQLRRTKTDVVDAAMIAEFCQQRRPSGWTPPPEEILELRGLLSYREHIVQEMVRIEQMVTGIHVSSELRKAHRHQLAALKKTRAAVEKQLRGVVKTHEHITRQVKALTAVSGIGLLTASSIVARLPVERLRDGKAAVAYVGLAPSERQSGSSVHGKPRICKTGNAELRRNLYMPAMSAIRHNPILQAFAERLRQRGKAGKVIVVAVMRKLLVLAFTLLRRTLASSPALAV